MHHLNRLLILAVTLAAVLLTAPGAVARDGYIASSDGTKIVYWLPATGLKAGDRAPTVTGGVPGSGEIARM